jgi:DNA repair protein RadC
MAGEGKLRSPKDTYNFLRNKLESELQEVFVVIALNSQSVVLAVHEVTRGILNASLIHPREVFAPAIVDRAAGIIIAHNHPSGDPTPSSDDRACTRQLIEAGRVLDIPVYDHIILGQGRFISFAESGLM